MNTKEIDEIIAPFFWVDSEKSASVCLNVGEYKMEVFQARAQEGFEGGGYDWASLAKVYLAEQKTELTEHINFDPEGSMYCVYSSNKTALKEFSIGFKEACENQSLITDLFSRAELD